MELKVTRREAIAGAAAVAAAAGLSGCVPFSKRDESVIGSLPSYGVPSPTGYLRSNWSKEPYTLCSYSALAPGPFGLRVREMLAEPLEGRLFFAGEATSSRSPAYVHGGLLSGQRAAGEVIAAGKPGERVTVVGAGVAGMACARDLIDAGLEVELLDARDRTGGRIWTEELDGAPAEMGASWITGVDNNPLTGMARKAGVDLLPFNYDYGFVDRQQAREGRRGDIQLRQYLNSFDWSSGAAGTTPVSNLLPKRRSPGLQWAVAFNITQDYGVEPENLAVLATDEGSYELGGDALIRGSYQQLITEAAGKLPLRLDSVVKSVSYSGSGVEIALADGDSITSDYAVVTFPIGVLKAGSVEFDPVLPGYKRAAVESLGLGLLDKLWLSFDEVFWDADAEMIHWIDPKHPGLWAEWVNGYRLNGKPTLLAFNGGALAHEVSNYDDRAVIESAMTTLDSMFG